MADTVPLEPEARHPAVRAAGNRQGIFPSWRPSIWW